MLFNYPAHTTSLSTPSLKWGVLKSSSEAERYEKDTRYLREADGQGAGFLKGPGQPASTVHNSDGQDDLENV